MLKRLLSIVNKIFDGKQVVLVGFLSVLFGAHALCPVANAADQNIQPAEDMLSVSVDLPRGKRFTKKDEVAVNLRVKNKTSKDIWIRYYKPPYWYPVIKDLSTGTKQTLEELVVHMGVVPVIKLITAGNTIVLGPTSPVLLVEQIDRDKREGQWLFREGQYELFYEITLGITQEYRESEGWKEENREEKLTSDTAPFDVK